MTKLPVERSWALSRIRSIKSYISKSNASGEGVYEYYVRRPQATDAVMNRYGIPHAIQKFNDNTYRIVWSIPKDLYKAV